MRLPSTKVHVPRSAHALPTLQSVDLCERGLGKTLSGTLVACLTALALVMPGGLPPQADTMPSEARSLVDASVPLPVVEWGRAKVSEQARQVVQWSASTQDHAGMPFVVVDKQRARLYVFDASARLQAETAVLLGSAPGDHTVPGIGEKAIADVLPEERTTPAGRFHGLVGENLSGESVVWVDYDAAVSMHRVRPHKASEQRLARLASETVDDNRISYGCINVPITFFDTHILPLFVRHSAAIYVLPEQKSLDEVFGLRSSELGSAVSQ